jgi:hypothetical protein
MDVRLHATASVRDAIPKPRRCDAVRSSHGVREPPRLRGGRAPDGLEFAMSSSRLDDPLAAEPARSAVHAASGSRFRTIGRIPPPRSALLGGFRRSPLLHGELR